MLSKHIKNVREEEKQREHAKSINHTFKKVLQLPNHQKLKISFSFKKKKRVLVVELP